MVREEVGWVVPMGEDHAAALGWDGHLLLLHRSESERRAGLAAWVRRGLEHDERVIYTEVDAERPSPPVLSVLDEQGIDVLAATAAGRLVVMPLSGFSSPGGQVEVVERAIAEGYRGVRMSAEAGAALTVLPEHVHADYERTLDLLCRTGPVSALCQYDRAALTSERLSQITGVHAGGIRERQLSTGGDDDCLILAGEIDISNDELLTCALRAATSTASGTFRLDLSRVTFLSVAGCRALVEGTRYFRDRGGYLLLVAPRPTPERAFRLLGFDRVPHVALVGTGR